VVFSSNNTIIDSELKTIEIEGNHLFGIVAFKPEWSTL
jgi:hypothetical protein